MTQAAQVTSTYGLDPNAVECLEQLFFRGPTLDGDIVSKDGRGKLFVRGFADRYEGWSQLTMEGLRVAVAMGLERKKDKRERERSYAVDRSRRWLGTHAEQGFPGDRAIVENLCRSADTAAMMLRENGCPGAASSLAEHVAKVQAIVGRR